MKYLAIPQPTADWLLGRTDLLDTLFGSLKDLITLPDLGKALIAAGPLRACASSDETVLALWNADYLTGTGDETWGFIRLRPPFSLFDEEDIYREVFDQCVYIINQRLQLLLLDDRCSHKFHENDVHTCFSGRGPEARQFYIGYVESDVAIGNSRSRTIICAGPSKDLNALRSITREEGDRLPILVKTANELTSASHPRPILDTPLLNRFSEVLASDSKTQSDLSDVTVPTGVKSSRERDAYRTVGWTYFQWVSPESPLSRTQRRIIESDLILKYPIRITGPAGSGKTLVMQLLAMRRMVTASENDQQVRVLYIVHNAAMAQTVRDRFITLGASEFLGSDLYRLDIKTLADYSREQLEVNITTLIDTDAYASKQFQLEQVMEAQKEVFERRKEDVQNSALLKQVADDPSLVEVFARLVMSEISTAIKGHGLMNDERRYVNSERRLSRLHGAMTATERSLVFDIFRTYNDTVFEELEVLDSDDLALSLLGRLRTPIWELKRRSKGYDFIFVDETQLFNENERRLFPLLSRGTTTHVPIVLALDEAQQTQGTTTAGFGALGITELADENLGSNFRSTRAIVMLAFFVIQRTTDLFGPEFPDFTRKPIEFLPEDHTLASKPKIEICNKEAGSFMRFVIRKIRQLRKGNLRQIAVICHAETYWEDLRRELSKTDLPLHILIQRGEKIDANQPIVVLTHPEFAGGQEFDAVIAIGLEQGVVPPRIANNDALASAIEQQVFREIYLSFTRARYQILVLLHPGTAPTAILQEAAGAGLIEFQT